VLTIETAHQVQMGYLNIEEIGKQEEEDYIFCFNAI